MLSVKDYSLNEGNSLNFKVNLIQYICYIMLLSMNYLAGCIECEGSGSVHSTILVNKEGGPGWPVCSVDL